MAARPIDAASVVYRTLGTLEPSEACGEQDKKGRKYLNKNGGRGKD